MLIQKITTPFFILIAFSCQINAAPITLTPPDTLVIDGVSINQGIFTLQTAVTLDILQSAATGAMISNDLISAPVRINPAVIGSGAKHFLFDAPNTYLPLNIFSFSFEIVNPTPTTIFDTVRGVTFSAIPDFVISLPTTSGDISTGPAIGFEYIDANGQSIFSNNLFDNISATPDATAAVNFDIFADGSLYFIFQNPLDTPFSFQGHGGISGFTPPPASVPLPGAFWLMGSALGLVGFATRKKNQLT